MKLPGGARAFVEERKIRDYLLNLEHPDGMTKARYFIGRGYRRDSWRQLADDLRQHGLQNEVQTTIESPFGTRYSVVGFLETPSGERVRLVSVWIVEKGTAEPRLVTAYPA